MSNRLYELETREQVVKSQLALANGPDVVELHPQAAERYAAKVADIHSALSRGDLAGHEAIAFVRELVTRVRVEPTPRGEAVGLEIAGDLAALLNVNEEGPIGMAKMVAGVGFEPTSFSVERGQVITKVGKTGSVHRPYVQSSCAKARSPSILCPT